MCWLKACPRCHGDLLEINDSGDRYVSCIQCGRLLNAVQARRPEWFAVWGARGMIFAAHKQPAEARQALETAIALGAAAAGWTDSTGARKPFPGSGADALAAGALGEIGTNASAAVSAQARTKIRAGGEGVRALRQH